MIDNKDYIHGFKKEKASCISELDAVCYEYVHEKSGAHLIFLDRKDDNKTFAIGFKTIPHDNTGVFHILEHCVLCGSEKYPVKDPMTELIKGSLFTYLNALTYPDRTVYPLSSKNNKAFLDLMDVYLDAVFHPLAPHNKGIFMSEGHRYEISEDGELSVNGVVYNEMRGAYSSIDELCERYVSEEMFAGGTYSYDSGGDPTAITSLTFDEFCAAHRDFYRPDNACIFLDGSINVDDTFGKIDSFLSEYDFVGSHHEIDLGTAKSGRRHESYAIDKDESEKDKTRLTIAWRGYDHREYEKHLAITALLDGIADTNSSLLKSRVLSYGLCENMNLYYSSQAKCALLEAQFINVKDGAVDELIAAFDKEMRYVLDNEIDEELLLGSLKMLEFKTREADFGSYPRGMVYMSAALENFFYGESPADAFKYDALFSSLKKKLSSEYFADTLKEILQGDRTVLIMSPDKELEGRVGEKEKADLSSLRASMNDDDVRTLMEEIDLYESYVNSFDTDEALASMPSLSLSDLSEPGPMAPTLEKTVSGIRVIEHQMNTSGIIYADLFFDASDVSPDDLSALRLMTLLMPELDTVHSSADTFRKKAKKHLGDLSVFLSPIKNGDELKLYVTVKSSSLKADSDKLAELLQEYITFSIFSAEDKIKRKISQLYSSSQESITADALSTCISRVASHYDSLSALRDKLFGYEFHKFLKNAKDNENTAADLSALFTELQRKLFVKERLTLSLTCDEPWRYCEKIIAGFENGCAPRTSIIVEPTEKCNEGIPLTSNVGYTVLGGNLSSVGEKYTAALAVLSNIFSYELLWEEIRVKGGAYDTGAIAREGSGSVALYSYRDPSPSKSKETFSGAGVKIKEALMCGLDIEKYIISTYGERDTVTTLRVSSFNATVLVLSGKGEEYLKKSQNEILGADANELIRLSDVVTDLFSNATYCIAAPREMLDPECVILDI